MAILFAIPMTFNLAVIQPGDQVDDMRSGVVKGGPAGNIQRSENGKSNVISGSCTNVRAKKPGSSRVSR